MYAVRVTPAAFALTLLAATALTPRPAIAQEANEPLVNQSDDPILRAFAWRQIGPYGQGGRVNDLAVHPENPHTYFAGFATGGLWKTTNNGTTFRPVFDSYGTHSVGDIAISPANPDIVWVGTGEANNRQSSSFGDGMYKSTDGGETFTHVGLRETQTISRVIAHPDDGDVAWAAANGHLFGANSERGVFKTTDGGRTWNHVLSVDDDTGATDLVLHPTNPNTLFAATYQRRRTRCCFVGGGPGSGIWRSDDGGETWTRLSGNGLPRGTMGRVALAVTPADPDVVYAQIEVAADREEPLTQEERAELDALDDRDEPLPPDDQYNGIWRSTDGGASWEFRSNENGRPMYFSQIRVDPNDPQTVYVVDQRVHKSVDGARTFERLDGYGHVDQHAMWINPANSNHLLIGNDGGVDVSYDQGETWESHRRWAMGQPYHASVDMRRPYYVCTGLQDNGSWCGPSGIRGGDVLSEDWYRVGGGDGFYTAVDPTDHTVVYAESQNGNLRRLSLATGQGGSIRPRAPTDNSTRTNIAPTPEVNSPIRWNWNTPFILSPHNPDVIYAAGNRLFRSMDRGDTWTMSEDLTTNLDRDRVELMGQANGLPRCNRMDRGEECILSRNDGVSAFSTGISVAESPLVPGLLWVGTDDGNLQVSRDGGATWTEVGRNIPGGTKGYYVSRVEASHFDAGTAYASVDGHKSDDLRPYVYVTRDYGESWEDITSNLPEYGNVNTVRQDPRNARLLYAGTEFGFFVSLDEGGTWRPFMSGLPVVRIDDVVVHPRDGDLVLATHGRSVLIADDVTPLQHLTDEVMAEDVFLFEPREAVQWKQDPRKSRSITGDKVLRGENAPPGTAIHYWLREASGDVQLTVTDLATGEQFRDLEPIGNSGINRVRWNLRGNRREGPPGGGFQFGGGGQGPMAEPGLYRVTLTVDGQEYTQTVRVLEDIWMEQG
ncbi:MAG: hypothetical protein F4X15_04325 [Gemmatimonadetes bacterium]|nr:hypothetical protein [Gemmatimonadota bacterium]